MKSSSMTELKKQLGDDWVAILSGVTNKTRSDVLLMRDVDARVAKKCLKVLREIKSGKPLAYVLGKSWFYEFPFFVNKNVLIPRGDTEVLVVEVKKKLAPQSPALARAHFTKEAKDIEILDLCTGSGCIAITLAKLLPDAKVSASDISKKALKVARKNAELNSVKVDFIHSNLFENINGKFDMIVSNPPYVRTSEIGAEDMTTLCEPRIALDGGDDGLWFYRQISRDAREYIIDGGVFAIEIGLTQAKDVVEILTSDHWKNIEIKKDIEGRDRVITCSH